MGWYCGRLLDMSFDCHRLRAEADRLLVRLRPLLSPVRPPPFLVPRRCRAAYLRLQLPAPSALAPRRDPV